MIMNNSHETIYLNRVEAIILLVRLENADIPYPHSNQLIHFLTSILTDEERNENILKIDYEELSEYIDDSDSAIKIIKYYS